MSTRDRGDWSTIPGARDSMPCLLDRRREGRQHCGGRLESDSIVKVEKTPKTLPQVEGFLSALHGEAVQNVEALEGGFWSSAFAYQLGERELVVRLGDVLEGFEMDRAAMAFGAPDLPIPEVLQIGRAMGGSYAISVRHHGRFLESARPFQSEAVGAALLRTLGVMRAEPSDPNAPLDWFSQRQPVASTWRQWLSNGLVDDPGRRVSGWRATLAAEPEVDGLFRACERLIGRLLDDCPERRDLVHGDLLNRNVLIAEDASRITAVFSWKCSVRGDFLYDIAWCTFWGPWHPAIAQAKIWDKTLTCASISRRALADAALRHHCYELQIGANHLGWNAWTGDSDGLKSVAARTEEILERGPLAGP
jgi:aminoglycoside phosphotransferase (APT) family kinase protein